MEAFLLGFASNFSANLLSSIAVEVTPFLAKHIKALKFDAEHEVEKLADELNKAKELFDNVKTTDTWQLQTAEVFGVLCDIEDLLNDIMAKRLKRGDTKKRIKEVQKRLKRITTALKVGNTAQQQNQQSVVDETSKIPNDIVGREEEMEKIVELLLDDTISLVNIIGMGGLGKTVLACHALKDSRIEAKFRVIWVPMSAKFDLNAVADSIMHPRLKSEYLLPLPENIRSLFKEMYAGKSLLIVLDGLLDVKGEDWISFSDRFLDTSAGCKVLITTRNPRVASKTEARRYDIHLPLMRDEECRELVIQSALKNQNLDSRQVKILKDIAEAIAKMCKGLPLAASNLGHFLSSNCGDDDWMNLKDQYICDTPVFRKEIFPKLKLNTTNMSSHLTKCLAYCSLFPRDHHFNRDSLVELWVAAGFIPPQDQKTSLRDIGNKYFDDLFSRSFFQSLQPGKHVTSSYQMHEFIHNFAQFMASSVCFRLEDIKELSSHRLCNKVRHLSLLCTSSVPLDLQQLLQCDGLRTFLLPTEHGMKFGQIPPSFFVKLGRLQVLDLSHTDVVKIHESLGELKLLQYLDLSKTNIELLPKSISKLCGLQVLKLRGCSKLLQLPTDLCNLTNLVNLEVDIPCLASKDAGVGSLIYLQKLPKFFVGKEKGSCISELKSLKFLRGTLNLLKLENVEDEAKAREANLKEKQSLGRLELEWSSPIPDEARTRAKDVFAALEPQPYLKELKVTNYVGSGFPAWLTSQSCKLESIYVEDCLLDDVLSILGQLPFLKNLHLQGMPHVTELGNPVCRDGAYPLLESLKIIKMRSLISWHETPDNCMLKLSDLEISRCPNLISVQSLNHLRSLQTLEIGRCQVLEALPLLPPSVQSLIISESDMIKQQCDPGGPQRDMIRSIPRVEIDWQRIVFA